MFERAVNDAGFWAEPDAARPRIVTALIAFVAPKLLHRSIAAAAPPKRLEALCKNTPFKPSAIHTPLEPKPPKRPEPQLNLNFSGQQ